MKKTKTIIGLIILTNLIGAQGWHIYAIADLLSPYVQSPLAKTINATYLSVGLSCGLFFFCIFDAKNKKLLNWIARFEIAANNLCWIYTLFIARVFINPETFEMSYKHFIWERAYYYDLIIAVIFSTAIPLFIRAYATHIDISSLKSKRKTKVLQRSNKNIIDEL